MSVSGTPPSGGVFWLGEGSATLVVCVMCVLFFFLSVEEGRSLGQQGSAVAIVSHEGDDAGRGSRQLEEGVLEELLGRGSLRRLPHQHQVQEGPQHRGHLKTQRPALVLVLSFICY